MTNPLDWQNAKRIGGGGRTARRMAATNNAIGSYHTSKAPVLVDPVVGIEDLMRKGPFIDAPSNRVYWLRINNSCGFNTDLGLNTPDEWYPFDDPKPEFLSTAAWQRIKAHWDTLVWE
jgi:hypothetical protein